MTGREDADLARVRETSRRMGPLEYRDAHGTHWHVTERDSRNDPGARADWCLIFACDEAVRRVWSYPESWRDLSAEALTSLSWGR